MKDIFEVKQASKFDESFPDKTFIGRDKNEPAQRLAMPMILLSDFWSNKTEKMITMIDHVLQILFFVWHQILILNGEANNALFWVQV